MKKLLVFILLSFALVAKAEDELPTLKFLATDLTNTLSADQILSLNRTLTYFQDSTSNQLVFLMIATTNGDAVEDYANQVALKNKIGTKQNDNGILFLVVKDDKKIRIEVGYGLEGALPDAITSSIIRNEILPYFKSNDYAGGVFAGVDAIIKATAGEYKADARSRNKNGSSLFKWLIPLIIILTLFRRKNRGIYLGGGGFGSGFRNTGGFGGFGSFGGFGGGGGGFGGFSGGGGSFGGGGASGSW